MGRKHDYDWARIEADWRTDKFTNRELSEKHGPAHQVIARRALKEGWKKDLSDAVRNRTAAMLVERKVSEGVAQVTDTIEAAALSNIKVIESQRSRLGRLQAVVESLADELAGATRAAQKFAPEEILSLAEAKGLGGHEVSSLLEMAQVAGRATVADRLAGAYAKLIPLERKVHSLDKEAEEGSGGDQYIELARQLRARREAACSE